MSKNKIVVDEAVSNEMVVHFQIYLSNKGYKNLDLLFIGKEHQGMPDGQILRHLLNNKTIFLTTDKPLHNKALSQGVTSYYIDKNIFVSQKIRGIKNKNYVLHKNDLSVTFFRWVFHAAFLLKYSSARPNFGNMSLYNRFLSSTL